MNMKTMAIAIGFIVALCAGIFFYAEWEKARFDASLPEPPAPEVKAAETEGGHWHGDEWHAEPHNVNANFVTPIAEPPEVDFSVQPTAAPAEPPAELAEILATPKYVERLQVIRNIGKHDPVYAEWAEKQCILEAEQELLWQEDDALNVIFERIENLTPEERQDFAKKVEALSQKRTAWHEKRRAHQAERPALPKEE